MFQISYIFSSVAGDFLFGPSRLPFCHDDFLYGLLHLLCDHVGLPVYPCDLLHAAHREHLVFYHDGLLYDPSHPGDLCDSLSGLAYCGLKTITVLRQENRQKV